MTVFRETGIPCFFISLISNGFVNRGHSLQIFG
ncbi:MAG TPA: hypothetical protein DEB17_09025 [Chlorobaculum sp.]|uniref:Uncharacterized protein n=1 Tax=Chlorobaculum tepidum (strain ATCC 49652 / DSM 12025 / NBRC 103806 / TLS) TaxID=194439 RepID=Q8KE29_CHLTE|nr:hypothetical protein CT0863 [Chlorobaculum tepidum TLS]HBU24110.1 hypothetical protein [Chlorobaculum sp.]